MNDFLINYNKNYPITISIKSSLINKKVKYVDVLFLERIAQEFIDSKMDDLIDDLTDEVIYHLKSEMDSYNESNGFDYYFKK